MKLLHLAPFTFCAVSFPVLNCISQASMPEGGVSAMPADSVVALAIEAYIYSYPLVMIDKTMKVSTNFEVPVPGKANAPVNQFGHFRSFPDATFKDVVKPNNDTYYSIAWLDLKQDPMVLRVPNTHGRYYLMPMLDAYSNVFASPGKRTTGTEEKTFLISGPDWKGSAPKGMEEIKAPTNLVWVPGRTQVNSAEDGASVVAQIQDGYKLVPLSKWGTDYVPEKHKVDPNIGTTPPPVAVEKMDIETYFNDVNGLLAMYPPPAADSALLKKISAIGVGQGKTFNLAAFDTAVQTHLKKVGADVHKMLREAAGKSGSLENGWNVKRSGMGSYGTNYRLRALIAMVGLGANLNADASYPICRMDENGNELSGDNKYVIHFGKGETPPVNAFWSITLYGPDNLLVANTISRFAIGDRNDLKYNADGSLDIFIQHENPGKEKESNWLPSGKGKFNLTMRLYWPKEEFLNGTWKVPPVKKVR